MVFGKQRSLRTYFHDQQKPTVLLVRPPLVCVCMCGVCACVLVCVCMCVICVYVDGSHKQAKELPGCLTYIFSLLNKAISS